MKAVVIKTPVVDNNQSSTTEQKDVEITNLVSNSDEASTSKQKEVTTEIEEGYHGSAQGQGQGQGIHEDIHPWAISIAKSVDESLDITAELDITTTIPIVPKEHRCGGDDAYEPRIISIGPYHRGKPNLQPMERVKLKCVKAICNMNAKFSVDYYIRKMEAMEMKTRSCYSENIELLSKDFVEMMLIDGCFIAIYLLHCRSDFSYFIRDKIWVNRAIRNDLLLLENQLPFFVVAEIYCIATGKNQHQLVSLSLEFVGVVSPVRVLDISLSKPLHHVLVHHLLHLYQWYLFASVDNDDNRDRVDDDNSRDWPWRKISLAGAIGLLAKVRASRALLARVRALFAGASMCNQETRRLRAKPICTIPSATLLEEAGIKFAETKDMSRSVMDVRFKNGVLTITPLLIDAFTLNQFRNLIALEKLNPYMEPHVAAFTQFMNCIIDTSKDVELLRKNGIIEHALGSDEEVATIFNQLTDGTLGYQSPELMMMYKDVNKYCKTKRHYWRAILMRDHFGNPWAAVSIVAAVILLSFTFIQAFFAVYGYFKPPSAS